MSYTFKTHPRHKALVLLRHEDHDICIIHTGLKKIIPIHLFCLGPFDLSQTQDFPISCLICNIPLPDHIITQIKLLT